jgi:hypothetical protein
MTFDRLRWSTVATLGAAAILFGAWATTAQAAGTYTISGNARYQIGDGLPLPIRGSGTPDGGVKIGGGLADGTGTVTQAGPKPYTIHFPNAGLAKNFVIPINLPLYTKNAAVFQVLTNLVITYPTASSFTFKAGGRRGASVVSWCPGDGPGPALTPSPGNIPVPTSTWNPGCPGAGAGGTGGNIVNGRLVYTKAALGSQFGGAMATSFTGTADVALNVFPANNPQTGCGGAPIHPTGATGHPLCIAAFQLASPSLGGTGNGTWGSTAATVGKVLIPGIYSAYINDGHVALSKAGQIQTLLSPLTPNISGVTNAASNWFAPYTTGMINVTMSTSVNAVPETFILTGSDNRDSSGNGDLSLVGGSISFRKISLGNANRGWLNFTLSGGDHLVPSISLSGLAALVGLMSLVMVRRSVVRKSKK